PKRCGHRFRRSGTSPIAVDAGFRNGLSICLATPAAFSDRGTTGRANDGRSPRRRAASAGPKQKHLIHRPLSPPPPPPVRALFARPSIRVVIGARQQLAGARRLDDVQGTVGPKLRTLSIERHKEVQPLAGVSVRDREQRGIGDIEIGLIERDLSEISRVLLLEPVALDFSPARSLDALVFP